MRFGWFMLSDRKIMSFIGKPGVAYGLQKKTISKPIGIFANADDDEEETGPIDARARTNLSIARAQAAQKKAVRLKLIPARFRTHIVMML